MHFSLCGPLHVVTRYRNAVAGARLVLYNCSLVICQIHMSCVIYRTENMGKPPVP